ncbi:UDP-3-O-(3-hydroxymyristoyl)glucosamine N-acyltransferase [Fontisubflavum oceani]|uniref:UDP-3-O-(3-hydroxymyristoyl)glucosamine N-acyltransferase n=1 Tax=Fontisubflavum oceani TaxID=2978973 RepID=UPI0025B2F4FE|nr:UDP-3-O-(3-hydroxymyristoyl)glucosamine N-acyltransferase [Fontisubflavum oceani]WJY20775.1 UDP-3-O-(3-hydroxymyristoyl)glucosamine N-acyltransferase [Fontisubflavum oceani]
MSHTIKEIAAALGAEAFGAVDLEVTSLAEPTVAGADQLALAMSEKFIDGLAEGQARAAVLSAGTDWQALGLQAAILVSRPRYALAGLTTAMDAGPHIAPGHHATAVIDPSAEIGDGAAIGPFVVIGAGAKLGANAKIAEHVSIGAGAVIGDDAVIHSGARVGARVSVGDRVFIQPGAVIGGDGFSFVTPEKSTVETARESLGKADVTTDAQSWTRIHSLGSVTIGDDVEIGANSAIDRGTISNTEIGDGTKLDNLVHIGHNVRIGRDCLICGQVGSAGSVVIGDRVVLGGQCGLSDNITIGNDVVAAGATKIYSNVPAGRMLMGAPAVKMDTQVEIYKAMRRLPRVMKTVDALQKAVFKRDQND